MKLDHIGYITNCIEKTRDSFTNLGYISESIVEFETMKCKVCFLRKEGDTTIELVEPYEDNKSLCKLLKNGVTPYHLCYEVENIYKVCSEMNGNGYFLLSEPLPAPAFKNRLICYLWSRKTGFIELVNNS